MFEVMSSKMTRALKWLEGKSGRSLLRILAVTGLLIFLFLNHSAILRVFNFRYIDMDQMMMWLGVDEMRAGRFHMPRYFGQNYGSMLEAWLAIPFKGVAHEFLFPLISYSLLSIPYVLIALLEWFRQRTAWAFVLPIAVFASLPTEFVMMGSMPRDMVSGVFVAALCIPFINSNRRFSYTIVGALSVLGWSLNSNAAVLAAPLVIYKVFCSDVEGFDIKGFLMLGLGLLLGGAVHFGIGQFMVDRPELVVHRMWPLSYDFNLLLQGLSALDKHFGYLVPFFKGKGIIVIILMVLTGITGLYRSSKPLTLTSVGLLAITLFSLGVPKVHDATGSVFFSYERMFIGLPVGLAFLLSKSYSKGNSVMLSLVCIAFIAPQYRSHRFLVEDHVTHKDHMLTVDKVENLYADCAELEQVKNEYSVDVIIYGPGRLWNAWVYSRGCPVVTSIDLMVRPDYERKTWDMRKLDAEIYGTILWFSRDLSLDKLSHIENVQITVLHEVFACETGYLIKGKDLNPIEIYRSLGYEVSNY